MQQMRDVGESATNSKIEMWNPEPTRMEVKNKNPNYEQKQESSGMESSDQQIVGGTYLIDMMNNDLPG